MNDITNILIISGGSGSGKTWLRDTIYNHNKNKYDCLNYHIPLQITTRSRRTDESSDDYMYIEKDYYKDLLDDYCLTATTTFNNQFYGTLKKTIVKGKNNCNIIIANYEGIESIVNTFENDKNVNIKKILVLSDPDDNILKDHNDRCSRMFMEELMNLLKMPFDMYVPNYINQRITEEEFFSKFDINKLFKGD